MRSGDNYVHQIDVIFSSHVPDAKDAVSKVVYAVRSFGGLNTEPPQWWEENSSPTPTEAEKANWTARIKALLGISK